MKNKDSEIEYSKLKPTDTLLFKAIVGSRSFGTDTETSDIDYRGVYIQSSDDILSYGYTETVIISKDESIHEIRKFLDLLRKGDPSCIELLFSPEDCIVYMHPSFEKLLSDKDLFLNKQSLNSFYHFGMQQLNRSVGHEKMQNWDKKQMKRKEPIDFVHICIDGKSIPIKTYLKRYQMKQEYCGLTKLNHMKNCFGLYYDNIGANGGPVLGYKGIQLDNSNDVRKSSIPKHEIMLGTVMFAVEEYSQHASRYKKYLDWKKNRNEARYVEVENHMQTGSKGKIDGKNLLHAKRLVDMSEDILNNCFSVKRNNREELLSIKQGKVDLQCIIDQVNEKFTKMKPQFQNNTLPNVPNHEYFYNTLLYFRKYNYTLDCVYCSDGRICKVIEQNNDSITILLPPVSNVRSTKTISINRYDKTYSLTYTPAKNIGNSPAMRISDVKNEKVYFIYDTYENGKIIVP